MIGERLEGPGVTVTQAHAAIAGAVAAMEIVDSRIADWRIKLADTVADLASNGAMATSSRVVPLTELDPRLVGMTLTRNGELVDTGAGAAALGDPVAVVAWLAQRPRRRRRRARARPPDHDRRAARRRAHDTGRRLPRRVRPARPDHRAGGGMTTHDFAARLQKAVADRTAIDALDVPDLATGYAVQRELRTSAGPLVGWKLGVTSRAKQAQVGVDSPVYGFLEGANALDVGAPLDTSALIQPRCEPEIVFVLGRDLAGPHVTAADVIGASSGVAVGIEVLDSRYRDYKFTMPDVVADNTSAGRFVVGTPVPTAGIDLRLVGVVLEKNGEVVATASGAASLGHPAAAVAWMVRTMAADGEGLRAGDVVLSGGLTAAVPVAAGDVVVAVGRPARHTRTGRSLRRPPCHSSRSRLARGRTARSNCMRSARR